MSFTEGEEYNSITKTWFAERPLGQYKMLQCGLSDNSYSHDSYYFEVKASDLETWQIIYLWEFILLYTKFNASHVFSSLPHFSQNFMLILFLQVHLTLCYCLHWWCPWEDYRHVLFWVAAFTNSVFFSVYFLEIFVVSGPSMLHRSQLHIQLKEHSHTVPDPDHFKKVDWASDLKMHWGKFTPVLAAVHSWSDHPGYMSIPGMALWHIVSPAVSFNLSALGITMKI